MRKGNCYFTSEAVYHLLGGKDAGWKPMRLTHEGTSHWYIQHESGFRIDLTKDQFKTEPDYSKGKGNGFLTKKPSFRAAALIDLLQWYD